MKFSIAIHGGAGPDSDYIRKNFDGYKQGIETALNAGYVVLEKGGSSVDAVETAIRLFEDNEHFNAGRGSALNERGEVEMCASIMRGEDENAGAAAIIRRVRNPISLARAIMEKSKHTYLGSDGAIEFARQLNLPMEADSYFITEHALEELKKARVEEKEKKKETELETSRKHGTVGAVALDKNGDLAAGTSTGGLELCKVGRIADSSMIGVGTYANNKICAVSTTGEGEFHIKHVTAFHIAALMEYKNMELHDACHFLIHEKCKNVKADMGLIAADPMGNIVAVFNTERMHRGLKSSDGMHVVEVYP
ncbi:MAG: isoaspartyl peptidase/L-asparaginase family protein [Flavisolibacter sp.]